MPALVDALESLFAGDFEAFFDYAGGLIILLLIGLVVLVAVLFIHAKLFPDTPPADDNY